MILPTIMRGVSQKINADFELITSQLSHSLSKGLARETVLANFLAQYLPPKFGVGNGQIISSLENESVSGEMDIVIYDRLQTPLLFNDHNRQIFPVETVYAVIQVKSVLNSQELGKAQANILTAKRLTKRAYIKGWISHTRSAYGEKYDFYPIRGYVFAYSSVGLAYLWRKLVKLDIETTPISKRIDYVAVHNKGLVLNAENTSGKVMVSYALDSQTKRAAFRSDEHTLALFYLMLMGDLSSAWCDQVDISAYLNSIEVAGFDKSTLDPDWH